jgi:type 1 fimbria pilin
VPLNITNSDGSIKPYFMAEQVCTFTSNIVNVALPNISSVALGNIPNSTTLGQTAFTIGLTACPTYASSLNFSYLSLANFSFTTPSASDKTLLSNTTEVANGGAGNVYVQLLDANKAPIQTGQAVPMTQNGNTTFFAQYITAATGTVTPGLVTGIANITMSYK